MKNELPIALSNRHCHLTQADICLLFGDCILEEIEKLSQPHEFVSNDTVMLQGPKGTVSGLNVKVIGPARSASQVEVLASDCYKLGIPVVVRNSGDIEGSPPITIIGPNASIDLPQGAIVAARHIHMSLQDAEEFGVSDREIVHVETEGERALIFKNVLVRSNENYALEMHVDLEEGNAAGVKNGQIVKLIKL